MQYILVCHLFPVLEDGIGVQNHRKDSLSTENGSLKILRCRYDVLYCYWPIHWFCVVRMKIDGSLNEKMNGSWLNLLVYLLLTLIMFPALIDLALQTNIDTVCQMYFKSGKITTEDIPVVGH
jgi:hypothetical protein